MSRRVLGLIASVALAAAGTFVLLAYVNGADQRAAAGEEVVPVLIVAEHVDRGTAAADLGDLVKTTLVPAKVRADGAVADLADLGDGVAAVDLAAGEQLLAARFVSVNDLETEAKIEVPDGLLQVTVSLSPERAVGGRLRPGSTVGVLASFEPFDVNAAEPGGAPEDQPVEIVLETPPDEPSQPAKQLRTPNSTHVVLHKVLVTNVQIERLPAETATPDVEQSNLELAPTGNLLVTLAVTAPDAEKVVFAAEHGTVWLAAEPDSADESGTAIQTRGTIYR